MLRTTVLTIASAINYGVAMASTALVVHLATGGLLPVQATVGLVLAAGGIYAVCTAAVVHRVEPAVAQPVRHRPVRAAAPTRPLATITPLPTRVQDQPAMALASSPSSMSA